MCNSINVKETENGALIEVFVKPNSRRFKITSDDGEIFVYCKEQPVKGKVNKEITKGFSKLFHTKVELVSGLISKQKRLIIIGIGKSEVEQLLGAK